MVWFDLFYYMFSWEQKVKSGYHHIMAAPACFAGATAKMRLKEERARGTKKPL